MTTALAVLSALPLTPSGPVQLLPAGEFAARDGRPGPGKKWRLDDVSGPALVAEVNRDAALNELPIDYEHQTLLARSNGQPAPAAGWVSALTWEPGRGVFTTPRWTAAAKARIEAGEYRYISPVISYDPDSGQVTGLQMAALTNKPGLQGMQAVLSALDAYAGQSSHTTPPNNHHRQEPSMSLAAILVALGLPADTPETTALTAVTALKARAETPAVPKAVAAALGLAEGANEAAALSAITALKAEDSTTKTLIATLTTDLAALRGQLQEGEITALVDGAISEGKFLPAHRDYLLKQGRGNLAELKAYVQAAPVIAGLKGQGAPAKSGEGAGGGTQTAALTAQQKSIAASLGISEEAYAKTQVAA